MHILPVRIAQSQIVFKVSAHFTQAVAMRPFQNARFWNGCLWRGNLTAPEKLKSDSGAVFCGNLKR